jgi:hypothetical protein
MTIGRVSFPVSRLHNGPYILVPSDAQRQIFQYYKGCALALP